MSDCIVIAVLNGIEISHKLFTPEMVPDARAIRGCESVLGMPLCIPSAVVDYIEPMNYQVNISLVHPCIYFLQQWHKIKKLLATPFLHTLQAHLPFPSTTSFILQPNVIFT